MFDFNKMVDTHIAREHKPKQVGRYYPSEIGKCLRKTWYSYKYPKEVEPELLKIFEVGNIMHGFVVEVLRSEKNKDVQLLSYEFPFKIDLEDFVISGRVDDLLLVKTSGKNVLVEVKSTKSLEFINKPSKEHEMQLQFYMHATGVHDGVVLYVDKNNLQSKLFEVKFNEEEGEEIVKRFRGLHACLKSNELPLPEAKQFSDMNWMCRYCEYKDRCDKNEL